MVRPTLAALLLTVSLSGTARAQEAARRLTLTEAVALAKDSSAAVAASRARVDEMSRKSSIAFTNYLPRIQTQANYLVNNNTQGILLPTGSLGNLPALGGAFPPQDLQIDQGGTSLFFTFTTLVQPITHYFRIRHGIGAARADETAAEADLRKAEQEVSLGAMKAYAGLLLAQRGRDVARERVAAAEERMGYRDAAAQAGTTLDVAAREARVKWLQARQELLQKEDEIDNLTYALTDLLRLPPDTPLELEDPAPMDDDSKTLDDYVRAAMRSNPDVLSARALDTKANHGLGAAKAAYIPEVGLLGAHLYQNSLPFFPRNTFGLGIQAKWTILDFGARSTAIAESKAQVSQAEENVDMVEGRIRGEVETAYRKLERARDMVALAEEALELRTEGARLKTLESDAGYAVPAQKREARADSLEAEMDLLKARLGRRIAWAELQRAAGLLGR